MRIPLFLCAALLSLLCGGTRADTSPPRHPSCTGIAFSGFVLINDGIEVLAGTDCGSTDPHTALINGLLVAQTLSRYAATEQRVMQPQPALARAKPNTARAILDLVYWWDTDILAVRIIEIKPH